MPETKAEYYERRRTGLNREYSSFEGHYKELSEFIDPRRGRFFKSDRNKGNKVHQSIINSIATRALRIAVSGMLAGTMSPARPWFKIETPDPDLMEFQPVKEWLNTVERLFRDILNSSNFYKMVPSMLKESLQFGTGVISHEDDFENVAHFSTHTVGSYRIGQNSKFIVDTLVREFQLNTIQIVSRFGLENVSQTIRSAYDSGNYDNWYDVVSFIEPNDQFRPNSLFAKDKAFSSVFYEPGEIAVGTEGRYLQRSGFDEAPFHTLRWETTGEDIYGTNCPGMTALGDVKQVQVSEKRKAQAVDKMVNPPLAGPAALRNTPVNSLPGGVNTYEGAQGNELRAVYQVQPQVNQMREDIREIENRVNEDFFVNLFQAISSMQGIQPRNELDIISRNEEKLLQLGPVLEVQHGEFLDPMLNRLFGQCDRAGILPPPPEEIANISDLNVRYISTLAMAQRAVATQSLERTLGFVASAAEVQALGGGPVTVTDKFDFDQSVDEYARAVGTVPNVIVPDDKVEEKREQDAAAQAQAVQMEQAQQAAAIAGQLGGVKTGEENLLTDLTTQEEE